MAKAEVKVTIGIDDCFAVLADAAAWAIDSNPHKHARMTVPEYLDDSLGVDGWSHELWEGDCLFELFVWPSESMISHAKFYGPTIESVLCQWLDAVREHAEHTENGRQLGEAQALAERSTELETSRAVCCWENEKRADAAEVERLTGLLALSQEHFNEVLEASETNARRVLDLTAERDEARSEAEYLRRIGRAYQETALARAESDVRAAEAQHKDLATWVGALMEAPESSWRGMILGGYAHETVDDVRLLVASARKLSSEFSVWTQRGGAPPFRLIESVRDLRHALCALLDEGQQPKEEG